MKSVNYAMSPTGEIIAMAMGEKLAFLSADWDYKVSGYKYSLCWCGELEDPNSIVTWILCLPLYGSNVSAGAEWTCVIMGLSSGMVVFYNDAGVKIFSQRYKMQI